MKVSFSAILKFVFFIGLAIALIWLVVKDITPEEKTNIEIAFHQANYIWIIISILTMLLSHLSRAIRWKMLLQPLGHQVKVSNAFFAVMVGYLANLALPRLGEVTRCGVLNKYEKVPFNEGFGTVIAERAIDLICLFLVFVITILLEMDTIYSFAKDKIIDPMGQKLSSVVNNSTFLIVLLISIVLFIGILYLVRKKFKGALSNKLKNMLKGFLEGLKSVKNIKSPLLFFTHTIFIWFLYYAGLHISFLAFEEMSTLGIGEALSVLIFGSLGILFVPGGTGAYQKLVIETLAIFSISFSIAFAFAWIVWASQIIVVLIVGSLSLILLPIINKPKLTT